MEAFFEFEKPIANLEKKLQDLRDIAKQEGVDFADEIKILEKKVAVLIDETYSKLSPWQRVQLSRHPNRPYTRDYVDALFPDFMELQGDRAFGDDQALLGGTATWPPAGVEGIAPHERTPILILGHQKGRTTKHRMERTFGMAKPEGYRKAIRLVQLADRAKMPIITFIDTPGAYPGIEAEERGQAQAIAESIQAMFAIDVPVIAIVIGEGGSGGALAIGIANRVIMQEYSTYSVISPESCASILWSNSALAERAADKLKANPTELKRLGVIDDIVSEPKGGAHRDWPQAFALVREALVTHYEELTKPAAAAAKKGKASTKSAPAGASAKGESPTYSCISTTGFKGDRLAKFRRMGDIALVNAPVDAE